MTARPEVELLGEYFPKLPGDVRFILPHRESQKSSTRTSITNEESDEESQILVHRQQGRNLLNNAPFPLPPSYRQTGEILVSEVQVRQVLQRQISVCSPIPNRLVCVVFPRRQLNGPICCSNPIFQRNAKYTPERMFFPWKFLLKLLNHVDTLHRFPFKSQTGSNGDQIAFTQLQCAFSDQATVLNNEASMIWNHREFAA